MSNSRLELLDHEGIEDVLLNYCDDAMSCVDSGDTCSVEWIKEKTDEVRAALKTDGPYPKWAVEHLAECGFAIAES